MFFYVRRVHFNITYDERENKAKRVLNDLIKYRNIPTRRKT